MKENHLIHLLYMHEFIKASNLNLNDSLSGICKYVSKRKISEALLKFIRMSPVETYFRVAFATNIADPFLGRHMDVDHM